MNDVAGALDDAQVVARDGVVEIEHPVLGDGAPRPASPFRFDGARARRHARGPLRGEHTAALLRELCGYSDERIDELAAAGVFGDVADRRWRSMTSSGAAGSSRTSRSATSTAAGSDGRSPRPTTRGSRC